MKRREVVDMSTLLLELTLKSMLYAYQIRVSLLRLHCISTNHFTGDVYLKFYVLTDNQHAFVAHSFQKAC